MKLKEIDIENLGDILENWIDVLRWQTPIISDLSFKKVSGVVNEARDVSWIHPRFNSSMAGKVYHIICENKQYLVGVPKNIRDEHMLINKTGLEAEVGDVVIAKIDRLGLPPGTNDVYENPQTYHFGYIESIEQSLGTMDISEGRMD